MDKQMRPRLSLKYTAAAGVTAPRPDSADTSSARYARNCSDEQRVQVERGWVAIIPIKRLR